MTKINPHLDLSWHKTQNQSNKNLFKGHIKKDPLATYPTRGMAYLNEIGEAIRPLPYGSGIATALWIPALMYFGADIYDKYSRGENDDYQSTSKKKAVKQAVFQGLASVTLPTAMVKVGQSVASKLNRYKGVVDTKTRLELLEMVEKNYTKFQNSNKIESVFDELVKKAEKDAIYTPAKKKFAQKYFGWLTESAEPLMHTRKLLTKNPRDKTIVLRFLKTRTQGISEIINKTAEPQVEEAVSKFIKKRMIKPSLVKALGGFIALACSALPIDYFVEHIVIKNMFKPESDFKNK